MNDPLKIPLSWALTKIENIVFPSDKTNRKNERADVQFKYIDINSIDNSKFRITNPKTYFWREAPSRAQQKVKTEDIVFSTVRPYLKNIGFVPASLNDQIASTGFCVIRPHVVSAKYVYHFVLTNQFINDVNSLAKGTSYPAVTNQVIFDREIPIPPLNEQHRIVAKIEELFSELDNGVENLKLAQNQLKVYRQALLKHAFEGKLTKEWRKENNPEPAEKLLERIKEERQARYEHELKEWKVGVKKWEKEGKKVKKPRKPILSNLKIIDNDVSLPSAWFWADFENTVLNLDGDRIPLSSAVRSTRKGNIPYYGATGIVDHIDDYLFDGKYLLIGEDGANLLSKSRDLAFIAEGKFWVNNHAHLVQTLSGLDLNYLCYYFNSLILKEYVSGTAQPKLTQTNLNKIPIPYCSDMEQRLIVDEIESQLSIVEKLEETINSSLKKSDSQRQSILKKAFEGKLVDQDPNDEPASELLNRIQEEKKKYLEEQKRQKKKAPKKIKKMSKELSIEDVLKASKKPMLAKEVWQQSKHSGDIEEFYSELKKLGSKIEEIRDGMESKLTLNK